MTTNPSAKRILCYGDSNTWGQKPDKSGRFGPAERWTGIVQQTLGDEFEIIEEGLSSRTTDLDYKRKPGRNGKTYLLPCLQSQNPLDLVVLMLGTNDYKIEFGPRTAADIAKAIEGLVADIRAYGQNKQGKPPRIVLASPMHINGNAAYFTEYYAGYYDDRSVDVSRQLAGHLARVAKEKGCFFFDAATVAQPGTDGVHMSHGSHDAMGAAMAAQIPGWV